MEKYSQNNEQEIILNYFSGKPVGKFLEIGAYHPTVFSNTRSLYESGWVGVYVEPSEPCYEHFVKEYDKDERIILLNVAIAEKDGPVTFYESGGDAISSTSPAHVKKWEAGYPVKFKETEVAGMAMSTLLTEYGKDVDFLNLDVEGTNIELFNLIPDTFWQRLKMICIEHDGQQQHIINRLAPFGFKQVGFNGENLLMGKI